MVKRLLLVEDSATMRQFVQAVLANIPGIEIVECQSGFEALKILPHESFHLVLTDINMPDINGLELIHFLKTNEGTRALPIIVLTTESAEEDRRKAISLGADDYIVKPFVPEQLRDAVTRHLQGEVPQ